MDTTIVSEDIIIDRAELTCNIEDVHNGNLRRVYEVSAYPTTATRNLTKSLSSTTSNLTEIAAQCQWVTPGILRFFVHPSTQKIVEARPTLGCIEISLQSLLNEQHKQQLAAHATKLYKSLPVTAANFNICPFRTFVAELQISVHGIKRKFFGMLEGSKRVHPLHVHFEIEDEEDLKNVAEQLENPDKNEFRLQYYYTLSGSSTTHANITITADQVVQCKLANDIFGDSQMDSMIVSRSYIEKIGATMTSKLNIFETVGVGAAPINGDLVKQAIVDAITSGFKKYSVEQLREQLANGTKHISDDLKANIINSYQQSQDHNDYDHQETSHEIKTSALNEIKTQNTLNEHDVEKSSQSNEGSISGGGFGVTVDLKGKMQKETNNDSSTVHDVRHDAKTDKHISFSNKRLDETKQADVQSSTITGTKTNAKIIDAAIIDRWRFQNGFIITLDRWVQQMASTYVTGCLTKDDIPSIVTQEKPEAFVLEPRGCFCGILKAETTSGLREPLTDTDLRNAYNILITGRSGVGKSTLIDLIHNYFLNSAIHQLQRIVDPSSERRGKSMMSSTSACVRYIYRSADGYLYQIIDSPGLADTCGEEEDQKNIQLITAAAETVKHINCILFVCNGTGDTRLGLDIRTTFVLLKNNLPTAILDNVMGFFTFTSDLSVNKCDLNEILRLENGTSLIDVERMPKFCADSSFFDPISSSSSVKSRIANQRRQEDNYDLACEQLDVFFAQVRQMRRISSDVFSAVTESRYRIMANIATIRVQLNLITKLVKKLDAAKSHSSKLDSQADANKHWKKQKLIKRPEQINVPYKNTLCSIHCCNCHIKCQLQFIEGIGSSEFRECAAFNKRNTCSHPDCSKSHGDSKCTFEHHYHDHKEWQMVEKTVEVVYEDMREEYYRSVINKREIDAEISVDEEQKKVTSRAFDHALVDLLEECREMKCKVKGFNLIAYIDVVLEALNKNIQDISRVEKRSEMKAKVEFFKTLLERLQNPPTSNLLTYRH